MPIVAMPDGAQVRFPDDMPSEQIRGMIATKFPELAQNSQSATQPEIQKPTGFTADMVQRGADLANIVQNPNNQAMGSRVLQALGGAAGTVGDAGGAALGALAKGAYNIMPEAGQQRIDSDIQRFSKVAAPVMQQYQRNQDAYNQANPEAGKNFQAVRELGNVLPLGAAPVRKAAEEGVSALGSAAKGIEQLAVQKSPIPTADEIRNISSQSYANAERLGGNLKPEFTNKLIDQAHAVIPKDPFGKIGRGTTISDKFAEELTQFRDRPMTLSNAEALDKNLTDKIANTFDVTKGGYNAEGRELIELQSKFRDMIENPDNSLIDGGREGFDSYRKATKEWAASRRMDDVENIFLRAEMTDNPAISIKTGFRTLAMNPKRMRGYTPAEAKLIQQAAKSGITADLFRTAGSRLFPIIAGATGGGLGGTAAAAAGSAASRGIAASMQAKRGEKVAREISKRISIPKEIYDLPPTEAKKAIKLLPAPEKAPITYGNRPEDWRQLSEKSIITPPPESMRALPAPDAVTVVNRQGDARIMTDAERLAAQRSRQQAIETGMTPDVRRSQIRNEVNKAYEARDLKSNAAKEEQIAKIAEQSSVPIEQLVEMADKNIEELSKIVGMKNSETAFAQALRMAIRNKGKK